MSAYPSFGCYSLHLQLPALEPGQVTGYQLNSFGRVIGGFKTRKFDPVFTARRHASAVIAVAVCLTACIKPVLYQNTTRICQGLYFCDAKDLGEIPMGLSPMGAPNDKNSR